MWREWSCRRVRIPLHHLYFCSSLNPIFAQSRRARWLARLLVLPAWKMGRKRYCYAGYVNFWIKFFALKTAKTRQLSAINYNTNVFPCFYRTLTLSSADCKDPGSPPNGVRSGNHFGHGKQITFACVKGFMLVGSATSVCHKGTWTHALPSCKGWFYLNHSHLFCWCEHGAQ